MCVWGGGVAWHPCVADHHAPPAAAQHECCTQSRRAPTHHENVARVHEWVWRQPNSAVIGLPMPSFVT